MKSLWVQWMHDYKIKGSYFWVVAPRGSMSWGWRKLLQMRDTIRPYIWKKIDNGVNTFVWTDNWCVESPLLSFITPRMIASAGCNLNSKVADLIRDNQWLWPDAWYNVFPVLIHIPHIQINDNEDRNVWKCSNGVETDFSSKVVWDSLRRKQGEVD
uniref:uncharacterized protein LOC122596999 n=1 Tax=Erigeron canadensis TaxID=72917 RepID=UPI001CB8FA31|nr:uncharacterized protein LOC122596999 [Erigeron canadensis]